VGHPGDNTPCRRTERSAGPGDGKPATQASIMGARLRHAWDDMAQQTARLLKKHRVGRVAIGCPKGILYATPGTQRQNQMTHAFWRAAPDAGAPDGHLGASSLLRSLRSETTRHSRTGILGRRAGEEVKAFSCLQAQSENRE
jgi:hypothetical protein